MKVMLVYPNDRMDNLISTSISILSAHLKNAGHDVKLYDTTFYDTGKQTGNFYRESLGQVIPVDLEQYGVNRIKMSHDELRRDFRKAVLDYNPRLIGFSTLDITYDQGLELANAIKDIQIPKIFGGLYPTFAPRIVLREPVIDMICEGEGEQMLSELTTRLENKQDITKILNLTMKQDEKIYRSGEVVKLEDLPTGDNISEANVSIRRPKLDLEKMLMPDYSIYDDKRFWKKVYGKAVRGISMELSRGCPFSCTFCCNFAQRYQHDEARKKYAESLGIGLGEIKKTNPYHREKSIDKFISELEHAVDNYEVNWIYITDESFLSTSRKRFEEFVEKYSKLKVPFFFETRVESVKPGHAEILESLGCVGIAMGIESGSQKIRRNLLNRLTTNEQIIKGFKEFEKSKICISANNIIGFPGETREDIMQTIELNKKVNANLNVVNSFRPFSGTKLRNVCIERGLIQPEERVEDNRTYKAFYNGVLSKQELRGIRRVFGLYVKLPKTLWGQIRKAETDDDLYNEMIQELREKIKK